MLHKKKDRKDNKNLSSGTSQEIQHIKQPILSFENHLFGGFLTAINSFSDEVFSKGLERAKFGDYTLLLKSIPSFLIFYLFKGQSFQAQKRIGYFAEAIQKENEIWQNIQKFYEANREIQLNDIPLLNSLLNDIFINKVVP